MTLRDTFGDPDDIAHFLLFQFRVSVEDAEMELL